MDALPHEVTYAFVSPLTTAGLGGMQTEAISLEGFQRAVAAIEDLETVAALEEFDVRLRT